MDTVLCTDFYNYYQIALSQAIDMDPEKEDMIDFGKLENELANAMANDEKYQRENDAKFRAIRQKVANYDEFRDIVLASHLKPLDKKDKSGGMSYQLWNRMMAETGDVPDAIAVTEPTEWTIPKTTSEFDKTWKKISFAKDRFQFLINIGPDNLKKFFVTDTPLGEIISCMHAEAIYPEQLPIVLTILEIITLSKRFSLNLDFLDESETDMLQNIFDNCETVLNNDEERSELKKLLATLLMKYKVNLNATK